MYIIKNLGKSGHQEENHQYHEIIVPLIFVALWVAGLSLSIINPQLPYVDESNPCSKMLSGLVCIYVVFILEVLVTFTDINNVYCLYKSKSYLLKIVFKRIIPNIVLTVIAFGWYYYHQSEYWLIPFVILSSVIKWQEVWLANNGEKIFSKLQILPKEENLLAPKKIF